MEEIWTHQDVKREYSRAYAVLADTMARGGPKHYGSAWPDIWDPRDYWENYHSKTNKADPYDRARLPRTSREISRMEAVMIGYKLPATKLEIKSWFAEFLANRDKLRICLNIHAKSELTKSHEKYLSRKQGIAYSTYRQRRDDGARIIAGNLNRLMVPMF